MSFRNRNLSMIVYANGFTMWHYCATDETFDDILKSRYFELVKTLMNIGDMFIVNASDRSGIIFLVSNNDLPVVKEYK